MAPLESPHRSLRRPRFTNNPTGDRDRIHSSAATGDLSEMTSSISHRNGGRAARVGTKESVSEIAASIASRLARSRDDSAVSSDPRQGDTSVLHEVSCAGDG